jgi:hypothetical protein
MSKQARSHGGVDEVHGGEAPESALGLVNPSTGLANDYLNVFSEILLLLEFLPDMPEMTEEALAWRPRGYCEYFEQSPLPGAVEVLRAYERIDPDARAQFESNLKRLIEIAVKAQGAVAMEAAGPNYPDSISEACEATAAAIRAGLAHVARLINEGAQTPATASRSIQTAESGA